MQQFEQAPGHSEESTLEEIYRQYWASLVRLGTFLSGSRQVAEDIVQDAFIRLDSASQLPDAPLPYLRRMVANGVIDHRRRAAVGRRHAGMPTTLVRDPDLDGIWANLAELPERQRDALVLRYYLDLSIQEVADYLNCPANTAKSLIHRGLAKLRMRVVQ
jgi:RNA polymerase sigma factor (sigma-70 family)